MDLSFGAFGLLIENREEAGEQINEVNSRRYNIFTQ